MKRKTLDRLAEEFVYGGEATPTRKETKSGGEKKENSFVKRLGLLQEEKEPVIRITVDLSVTLHTKLSILAARTGRKKANIIRTLLEETLEEIDVGEKK